jgi:HK97 family phage portal protein
MIQSTLARVGNAIRSVWRQDSQVNALNETRQNLTVQELANIVGGGAISNAGPVVNETTAMKVSAVYACVTLIAGAISTLPLPIYQRTDDGRERVDHEYWWLLNEQPQEEISAAVFWEYMVAARLFYGDCFAELIRPSFRSSRITDIVPHHPLRVQPFRDSEGSLWYRIYPLVGESYVLHPSDIIHVPSLGFDGLRSPSPITYAARQAIGTSLAASEYSAKFFSNGARPDFALATPGNMTEDQAKLLRATWGERHGGVSNSHLPAILTGGLDIKQLSLSAQDSQILATSNLQIEEIARTLGVPPHMIGYTEKSTSWGSGVENMGRGFVKFTLQRDLVKFEQELNRKLWPARQKYFVEFNVAGLERGDLKSENDALRIALGRAGEPGWMTQDEVRRLKNLPPMKTEASGKLNDGIGKPNGAPDAKPDQAAGE